MLLQKSLVSADIFFPFSLPSCHNRDHISPFVSSVLTNYGVPIYSIIALSLLNTWITRAQKGFIGLSPTNMLSPCELLTWETAFNRPCMQPVSKDGIQALLGSLRLAFPPRFIKLCAQLGLFCFREGFFFFFPPDNLLFVASKQNFIHNKRCKKMQWQPLICMRIAKHSWWLTRHYQGCWQS